MKAYINVTHRISIFISESSTSISSTTGKIISQYSVKHKTREEKNLAVQ